MFGIRLGDGDACQQLHSIEGEDGEEGHADKGQLSDKVRCERL